MNPSEATHASAMIIRDALAGTSTLADRLLGIGVPHLVVESLDEAHAQAQERALHIDVVLLPTQLASRALKGDLRRLRKRWPGEAPRFIAVGPEPSSGERRQLRAAGIRLGLWEPFDDACLRFQLNRARAKEAGPRERSTLRVPAHLPARVCVGGRSKDAVVYSLSTEGAFLETARASMDGALLDLEIHLPGQQIETRGRVVFANVPGNVRRPSLPLGMAVQFEDLEPDCEQALKRFVDSCLERLDL